MRDRSYLMGIAIWSVLIFHLFSWIYNPIGRFNIGYIGVDVFFFLSGVGLAHSYSKNGLRQFYINRVKRIYPVFFIAVTVAFALNYPVWEIADYLTNLTPAGFYLSHDPYRYDWYLESMLTIYLVFPLLYSVTDNWGRGTLFAVTIVVTVFLLCCGDNILWYYNCFIGRLPIFVYGMVFGRLSRISPSVLLVGLCLYPIVNNHVSMTIGGSLLAMPLIALSLFIASRIPNNVKRHFEYMGRHSLEVYCANVMILEVMTIYMTGIWVTWIRLALVIVGQVLFSMALITANRWFATLMKQRVRAVAKGPGVS